MKFYPRVIKSIARDIVQKLRAEKDIEVEAINIGHAEEDLAAVLREYSATEERVNKAAHQAMSRRHADPSEFGKIKYEMASVHGFKTGDEGLRYIITQMIEFLLNSPNVDEVYSSDGVIYRKIEKIIQNGIAADEELDKAVRSRLKNLQEGTTAWDIEYRKVFEQLRRLRGLNNENL